MELQLQMLLGKLAYRHAEHARFRVRKIKILIVKLSSIDGSTAGSITI